MELRYSESKGKWYFVDPQGHLFHINGYCMWDSKEEAVEAIESLN